MAEAAKPIQSSQPHISTLYGVPEGHDARILAERAVAASREKRAVLHICLEDRREAFLEEALKFFAPEIQVISLPAWDCLPYDRVSPNGEIVGKRVAALVQMVAAQQADDYKPRIILTTVNAVLQRLPPRSAFAQASFVAQRGGRLDMTAMQNFLSYNGYHRTDTVREPGEFAIRGDIIDLFPSDFVDPVRVDLFGDEVENIRSFDAMSQRSIDRLDEICLRPVSEIFLDEDSIARFRSGYREQFGAVNSEDPLYEAISAGRRYNGMEHWLPLFFGHMESIFDYVGDADISADPQYETARRERLIQIEDFYQARLSIRQSNQTKKGKSQIPAAAGYNPLPTDFLYLNDGEWQDVIADRGLTEFSVFAPPEDDNKNTDDAGGRRGRDFADIRAQSGDVLMPAIVSHITGLQQGGERKILIAAYGVGARERIQLLFNQNGLEHTAFIDNRDDLKRLKPAQIGICVLGLEKGFTAPDLVVLSEQDLLGDRLSQRAGKRRKADNFIQEISSLSEGDLVVHLDHGIGRFDALETLEVAGALHDCLRIVYDGGDKLYVPVENIEVLSRYGSDDTGLAKLDKLGGAGWQARKAQVKKDLMAMADHLLGIAAARELKKSDSITVPDQLYNEFSARFPYHETEDQARSINDVLNDMHSTHPMDRLVCGDVGFGKTEVALRAAFVAGMAGYQVAVVAPTTLLARQHYQNFVQRFKGFGLRVEQLSRMVKPSDADKVRDGLRRGDVNIVIGTHALLGQGVKFDNLGLVVVDEEQRFGVKQKERLKELKENVHVLTLTATPIPRTLQMALTGVREMSLITTPPVDRLAIRTFVLPYDPMVVREALMREHYRGGQSFYVCPRISDMKELEEQLKELVPEIKVISAHGQMPSTDLEDRMTAFYEGQYGILLATNIIESGLDIPSANTMIVHRADMFGLAQLYQIRGRIGRSKVRAYAYMTYAPDIRLNPNAQKRLEVIETLDSLGAGFQLASHDMDIRGAGNLLGEAQSGHIREIGVELYQQMLEEAVAAAREGVSMDAAEDDHWAPQINLGTSVLIPDSYVPDLNVRLSLYRRLSELVQPEDREAFAAELIDRFGKLPEEVENLLNIVAIKQLCKAVGVEKVEAGPKGAVITFHQDRFDKVEALVQLVAGKPGVLKIRPDQKLVRVAHWEKPEERVRGVQYLMEDLNQLS